MKFVQNYFGKQMLAMVLVGCFCKIDVEAGSFGQKIAMDSTGAAAAVWVSDTSSFTLVQANTVDSSGNWSMETSLSTPTNNASFPIVATGTSGTVALWSEFDTMTSQNVIMVSTESGSGWTTAISISDPSEQPLSFPSNLDDAAYSLSMNDAGVAVALWNSVVGTNLVIRSARFASGVWSMPVSIGAP